MLSIGVLALGALEWEHIGPRNIFNDARGNGESGTLADAVSPPGNPQLIYSGGSNNGAASGVLRTMDGGRTWERKSAGLFDTRIKSPFLHPSDPTGRHLFAGTFGTGIYESKNAGETWEWLVETSTWGKIACFRNVTIDGKAYIMAGTDIGLASLPVNGGN